MADLDFFFPINQEISTTTEEAATNIDARFPFPEANVIVPGAYNQIFGLPEEESTIPATSSTEEAGETTEMTFPTTTEIVTSTAPIIAFSTSTMIPAPVIMSTLPSEMGEQSTAASSDPLVLPDDFKHKAEEEAQHLTEPEDYTDTSIDHLLDNKTTIIAPTNYFNNDPTVINNINKTVIIDHQEQIITQQNAAIINQAKAAGSPIQVLSNVRQFFV